MTALVKAAAPIPSKQVISYSIFFGATEVALSLDQQCISLAFLAPSNPKVSNIVTPRQAHEETPRSQEIEASCPNNNFSYLQHSVILQRKG